MKATSFLNNVLCTNHGQFLERVERSDMERVRKGISLRSVPTCLVIFVNSVRQNFNKIDSVRASANETHNCRVSVTMLK